MADRLAPDDMVRVTKEALAYKGTGMGILPRGKRIKAETLLYGLIMPSGNDAAIALAQRVSGTVAAFVALMNARASRMGLVCTRFSSPDGFKDAGNHSCAADLAAMARAALDSPRVAKVVKRRRAILPFPIKGGRVHLSSHNPLILRGYPGALGIKTGYTSAAGPCFVGAAQRRGRRLGVVLLRLPRPRPAGDPAAQPGVPGLLGGVLRALARLFHTRAFIWDSLANSGRATQQTAGPGLPATSRGASAAADAPHARHRSTAAVVYCGPDWPISQGATAWISTTRPSRPSTARRCAHGSRRTAPTRRRGAGARATTTRTTSPRGARGRAGSPRAAWPASPGPRSSAARASARSSR